MGSMRQNKTCRNLSMMNKDKLRRKLVLQYVYTYCNAYFLRNYEYKEM